MSAPLSWRRGEYEITTDSRRIDIDCVHQFLTEEAYWARAIPREVVERSIRNSLCFVVLRGEETVGFARVISDRATMAYLGDVFVLTGHRGMGLSKWLMACIGEHPDLQGLRRWLLATADAHGLYSKFGFVPMKAPQRWLERHDPDVYQRSRGDAPGQD